MKTIASILPFLCLLVACRSKTLKPVFLQAKEVQLSQPRPVADSVFFTDSTVVHFGSRPKDCLFSYRLKKLSRVGTSLARNPDTAMVLRETAKLELSLDGRDYQSSTFAQLEVFQVQPISALTLRHSLAAAPYDTAPATSLMDRKKGSKNFRDGHWLGFQDSVVTLDIELPEQPSINGLVLSCLEDHPSWIFAPRQLLIRYYDEHDYEIFRQETYYAADNQLTESRFYYFKVAMETIRPRRITLEVYNLAGIPDWHPGKGNPPWLFIDEIALL